METADNLVPGIPQETSDKANRKAHSSQLGTARHSTRRLLLCVLRGGYFWSSSVDCTGVCTVSLSWRFLSRRDLNRSVRNSWLVADRQSAELVGRLEFVTVLKKLDSLGMPDIQKRSARNRIIRLFLVDRPSVEERIRNAELEP